MGNLIYVGFFDGTVDFDHGPGIHDVASSSGGDLFIAKLDPNGNLSWVRTMGSTGSDTAQTVDLDAAGNIVVCGQFQGAVDFDPGPGSTILNGGNKGIYCLKMDPAGNLIWAKGIATNGANGAGEPYGMDLDPLGNVYFTGMFDGTADFDPGPNTMNLTANAPSAFVCKLSPNGDFRWAKNVGGGTQSVGFDLVVDQDGNAYSTGGFRGTADFDPSGASLNLTATGSLYDIFVQKLDSSGNLVWTRSFVGNGAFTNGYGRAIELDFNRNVYTTGYFSVEADFDPSATSSFILSSTQRSSHFLSKLDNDGNFVWATGLEGGAGGVSGTLVARGRSIYWSGWWALGGIDLDPTGGALIEACSLASNFLVKMDTSGEFLWGEVIRSATGDLWLPRIHVTEDLDIYQVGLQNGKINAGPRGTTDSLASIGIWDGYLVKWHEDTCSGALAIVDSAFAVGCGNPGHAIAHMSGGNPPFLYAWNTVPPTFDSIAVFQTAGIYALTVTDSIGCLRERAVLIDGPSSSNATDLRCCLVAGRFRAGTYSEYMAIDGSNAGCVSQSGQLRLQFDSRLTFVQSQIPPDSILGNTLVWNHQGLVWDGAHLVTPLEFHLSPLATIGDSVCFDVVITPLAGDAFVPNNTRHYCYPVVSSYDPNDISVYPPGACDAGYVKDDQVLTYTIRFQNTGNADAIDIHILDSLSAALDLSSLKIVAQSHAPMVTEILPGNVLNFRFDGIHLPDSVSNEPGSHGYLVYEIKPFAGTPVGTLIENRASIYFDFNAPVLTNTVHNTIADTIMYANAGFTQNGGILLAQASAGSYQWLDCDNGMAPIPGETGSQLIPTQPGNYALQVTNGSCIATSACQAVTIVGTPEASMPSLKVYPNPNHTGLLSIDFQRPQASEIDVTVLDASGRRVSQHHFQALSRIELPLPANQGLYLVQVRNHKGSLGTYKVVRQ